MPIRTASAFETRPPKQKPVTPSLPKLSGRAFNHMAAAAMLDAATFFTRFMNERRSISPWM